MTRHLADRPRVVSVIGEPGIRSVPVGEQRGSGLHVARTNASIEAAELSGMAARRMRPDRVSRYFAVSALALPGGPAIDHLDGTGDEDLPGFWQDRKSCCRPGREFRLGRPRPRPPAGSRWGSIIDRRSFCASNQAVLYVIAELRRELECRHAVRVGCHEMRGPEPHCQRQI